MKKRGAKGKKTKKPQANGGIKYTVCGEFFPEPLLVPDPKCREGETPIDTEARLFCACVRWAFQRLLEGAAREDLKKTGQILFGLNSRRVDDAILKAQAVIDSQKELLPEEIKKTQTRLVRARKKLARVEKDLEKVQQGNDPKEIARAQKVVRGRRLRVRRLGRELAALTAHEEAGTIPKIVFGGRKLWRRVCRGQATNEEWQAARKNNLYARGDESKHGNPTIRISFRDGEFRLVVTISHLSEERGADKLGRRRMAYAPQVQGMLWIPEKHWVRMWELLRPGVEYTVELIKGTDGRYRAHISFTIDAPSTTTGDNVGIIGVDTNPDGLAVSNVGYNGQPEPWPEGFTVPYPEALHKFAGEFQVIVHPHGFLYIKIPELAYSRSDRRTYLIAVLATVLVGIATSLGKPLALEKLDFGKDRLDTNRRFNRMAANFPFSKVIEAIVRKAVRQDVGIKLVPSAHTSTIGHWKYMKRYGILVYHAAVLVIARRAMGFRERITKEIREKVRILRENLAKKVYSQPEEGTGTTRKARLRFKRLDQKLLVHNGLARRQQERFYSVWHDLKRVALSGR